MLKFVLKFQKFWKVFCICLKCMNGKNTFKFRGGGGILWGSGFEIMCRIVWFLHKNRKSCIKIKWSLVFYASKSFYRFAIYPRVVLKFLESLHFFFLCTALLILYVWINDHVFWVTCKRPSSHMWPMGCKLSMAALVDCKHRLTANCLC